MPHRRSASLMSVIGGILTAGVLTGAAVFAVQQVDCTNARYVQHGNDVELVGSCLDQHVDTTDGSPRQ